MEDLRNKYQQDIEDCKTIEELVELSQRMFTEHREGVRLDLEKQKIIDGFAGQVLQGMTAGFYSMDYAHGWKPEEIAKECYNIAEAMYKERNERNGK